MQESGAAAVLRELAARGVDTMFTVSGNQILPIFDAAGDAGIRLIHMRHETAAVYAAIGASETTGKPAVALVSAGPGFLASLQGLGVAASMECPVLLLSGGAPAHQIPYGAFQHLDQPAIARASGATSMRLEQAGSGSELLDRAWECMHGAVAQPVHIEMAADVLLNSVMGRPLEAESAPTPTSTSTRADGRNLDELVRRLSMATRPVIVSRPSASRGASRSLLVQLCERLGIRPLITESPRGLSDLKYIDVIPHLSESDCTLVVAPSDFAVGFLSRDVIARDGYLALIDAPSDPQPMHQPDIRVTADQEAVLRALLDRLPAATRTDPSWAEMWQPQPPPLSPDEDDEDGLHPLKVCEVVREMIRPEDTLILDGGEFCQWVRLGLRDVPNRMLWNGKLGAIGGGIPMALGVAASQPAGRVIAFLGDGATGYHLSEFETATRYGLPFVAIVGNDARWAAEWHMQASRYGRDRTFETELTWARYDIAAAGFGGIGYMADNAGDLWGAFNRSVSVGEPSCINVYVRAVRSPAVLRE